MRTAEFVCVVATWVSIGEAVQAHILGPHNDRLLLSGPLRGLGRLKRLLVHFVHFFLRIKLAQQSLVSIEGGRDRRQV